LKPWAIINLGSNDAELNIMFYSAWRLIRATLE
jgi:hypothetical protein